MAVVYLDPETEITGAVARLRAMPGGDVVLVVPAGSRLATSRINFRLLGREARNRDLRLAVVSDEPAARALSTAAGIDAYSTVEEAEKALSQPAARSSSDDDETDIVPVVAAAAAVGEGATDQAPGARPPRAAGRLSVEPPLYDISEGAPRRPRRMRRLLAPIVAVVLLLVLAGLALYGAYLFVPTATVTLTPKLIDIGPLSLTVTADPRVAVVDPSSGLVPASKIDVPLQVTNTFPATGTTVTMTAASGSVQFSSKNTVFSVPVPAGTIVSTANGIDFQTTASVTVPVANFDTHKPGTANAGIVATVKGPSGNVAADAIKKLPASLASALVTVRNPSATTGGTRTSLPVVTQSDYDSAVSQLTTQLQNALNTALADPAITPRGLTLYAGTAVVGIATPNQPGSAIVNTQAANFSLAVTASATVLAVNEALVDQVAQGQLNALVPTGTTLLPATVTTTHEPGAVSGQTVVYNASAVAKSWRAPDQAGLLTEISGQSVVDARAIMQKYGSVDIVIWPDFIDRLPSDQSRIRLTIVAP